jgi:hypothetical protein
VCGGRYDLRIKDREYLFFDPETFDVVDGRDLTLASVSGTSFEVGPDNLATFEVSAGDPLSNFADGKK